MNYAESRLEDSGRDSSLYQNCVHTGVSWNHLTHHVGINQVSMVYSHTEHVDNNAASCYRVCPAREGILNTSIYYRGSRDRNRQIWSTLFLNCPFCKVFREAVSVRLASLLEDSDLFLFELLWVHVVSAVDPLFPVLAHAGRRYFFHDGRVIWCVRLDEGSGDVMESD